MSVNTEQVRHIAKLARIAMSDAEIEALVPELNNILGWVEQLGEVDTDGVEPLTAVIDQKLRLRDDVGHRRQYPRRGARQRARRRARLLRGAQGDRIVSLTTKTIAELRDGFRGGEFTAREVAEAFNAAVAGARALNAFTVETPEDALAAADAADAARGKGEPGALAGIPLGIKDLFATEGVDTTAGSRILNGFRPPYELTVSGNLRKAGAGMLGKLNMDEFAMGSSNETSAYGPVISPWKRNDGGNAALTPGGSSGGSAAAVAAGIAPGATGTDTGGSIRQPAAFTGICGIKPTYGRCSRWGIVAFASSLDQAGPMARTVRDCAILLEAMAGFDAKDSTSLDLPVPQWEAGLSSDLKGKRVGIPTEYRIDGVPAEIDALWDQGVEWLRDAGAEPVQISLPHTKYALPTYYIIAPAEASSNLARYDGVRYGLRVEGDAKNGRARRHVRRDPRRRLRRRGQAANHDRHLCAVGGLLRRLFHQGAAGPHADQARLRGWRLRSAT